jgi:hypothetical protein
MSYSGVVIEVMIASPSDVAEEREVAREVIRAWNDTNARQRGVVLLATGWETHSAPGLDGRAQQTINERILAHSDLVIAIIGVRIGTPTGKSVSGTVEEIKEHHKASKPVMLYFSEKPVSPGTIDPAQYEEVKQFRKWAMVEGLVGEFSSVDDFRKKFDRHLYLQMQEHPYLLGISGAESMSSLLQIKDVWLEDVSHKPELTYPKKLRIVLANVAGQEFQVGPGTSWRPRPGSIHDRPVSPQLVWNLEGARGWHANDWGGEHSQAKVLAGRAVRTWVGLHDKADVTEVRRHLAARTLGYLLIPIKIGTRQINSVISL